MGLYKLTLEAGHNCLSSQTTAQLIVDQEPEARQWPLYTCEAVT
jgi:hypothetical protein